jgi:orotidine-5'-phosphate decarboxylase
MNSPTSVIPPPAAARAAAVPIVALDVPSAREAFALVDRLPRAVFVKVGLQLYTAEGPQIVRELRARGRRIFLDLKLHDIPNTVAGAVESAAALGVDLLTLHASGGDAMLQAAAAAVAGTSSSLRLLAVTVLTSLDDEHLAAVWGRRSVRVEEEVLRLANVARDAGIPGVVASVHEAAAIREALGESFHVLTPGIRLAGDAAGDQSRVATPAEAVRRGADYLVIGRTVTAAADPVVAYDRVLEELSLAVAEAGAR